MTIGPENFSNGASKGEDRFAAQLGQYRPGGRRDVTRAVASEAGVDLSLRNGTSMLDARNGTLDTRSGAHDSRSAAMDAAAPIASSIMAAKRGEPAMRETGDMDDSSAFGGEPWSDQPVDALVNHPLLRGLLMELPPKGAVPSPEYLDRWFEATRSILDLLYTMNAKP
ncbi:MAG: hypothetical protein HKP61_11735 [Dactylosporangium sp.]|nr:hypothetical protein [Dactylosporangium sp.]NNJ61594.1 hypothetical protein [Dactylosporangium sp.]